MPGKEGLAPLAVTMGDPAGIGAEIILKAWLGRQEHGLPPFIVIGDPAGFKQTAKHLELDAPVEPCSCADAGAIFDIALPVLAISDQVTSKFGKPTKSDGALVCEAIATAVDLAFAASVCGIVTAPINKKALYDAGFTYPGHTEYLGALASGKTGAAFKPVMMLAGPQLRAVPVTIHIPLKDVPTQLTTELIVATGSILAEDLRKRFGIAQPRIAISGLNPHAGEEGSMGLEDIQTILPAVKKLQASGIDAFGPLPADTMFHAAARQTYDAALCMYHDQALIPAKTLGFDDAVNVTLGLPFIRTSPDHGTAYDIAGRGIANPSSIIAAIRMAGDMAIYAMDDNSGGTAN